MAYLFAIVPAFHVRWKTDGRLKVYYGPKTRNNWQYSKAKPILQNSRHPILKDVRTHCYCASLVRTLFIRHARATSFASACTKSKSQQNIELMTFALTWCANIFVECWVNPTVFSADHFLFWFFPLYYKQKNLYVGSFNYFSYTIHIGWNW